MKKFVSLALCLAMIMAWIPGGAAGAANGAPFAGGSGTEDDPYLVSTLDQLKAVADYPDKYFLQTADISMNGGHSMSKQVDLTGTYDGGGHAITAYNGTSSNGFAIFRSNSGTIRNLGISGGAYTNERETIPEGPIGLLVGRNSGTIENCYAAVTSSIKYTLADEDAGRTAELCTGGLAGVNSGTIRNCYATGSIQLWASGYKYGKFSHYMGGIAGANETEGHIENCYSSCNAEAIFTVRPEWDAMGQLCGVNEGKIDGCYHKSETPVGLDNGTCDAEIKTGDELAEQLNNQNGGVPYWGWRADTYSEGPVLNYQNLGAYANVSTGACTFPVTVTLSLNQPGSDAVLYYAVKGSPEGKQPYTQPLTFTGETELFVYGQHRGSDKVYQVSYYHYFERPNPVTATEDTGEYERPVSVGLTAGKGENIWYTTDGSDPTASGLLYEDPITIWKTTQLKAAAEKKGEWGEVSTFQYTLPAIDIRPSVEPGGEFNRVLHVEFTCGDGVDYLDLSYQIGEGAEQPLTGPVPIYRDTEITVFARYEGQLVAQETFSYQIADPVITASRTDEDSFFQSDPVTFSCSVEGFDLYYNLDGSGPGENGTLYTGPVALPDSKTRMYVWAKYGDQMVVYKYFNYNVWVPEVKADPGGGDRKAPLTIRLDLSKGTLNSYNILYTLDGSDPKTSGTAKIYDEDSPIVLAEPEAVTLRAVPELKGFEGVYGIAGEFRYTFNSQKLELQDLAMSKRTDYEAAFRVSNTLPETKDLTFYAAAYSGEKLLAVSGCRETLEENEVSEVSLSLPGDLPTDADIKVFCLDSGIKAPCCVPLAGSLSSAEMIHELDSITVEPTSIQASVGDPAVHLAVTAHYTNDGPDRSVDITSCTVGDDSVVSVEDGSVYFNGAGSATLTVSYTEGGITRSAEVQITVVEPVVNLGFLANPEADPLPADAVPISTEEELAALNGQYTRDKTYYLANDIQLTGEWEPIYNFWGTLDGRGHTIHGLYVLESSNHHQAGLFSTTRYAVIKNLAVEIDPRGVTASDAAAGDSENHTCAAGLVGDATDTDFINCYTIGGPASARGKDPRAGGLVGNLMNMPTAQVINCFSTCDVSVVTTRGASDNIALAGGLIGNVDRWDIIWQDEESSISRCYATGDVSVEIEQYSGYYEGISAGGLIGYGNFVEISDCFAMGNVSAEHTEKSNSHDSLHAGGLCGNSDEIKLARCYAAGNVLAIATDLPAYQRTTYLGGLLASSPEASYNCYWLNQIISGHREYIFNIGTQVSEFYVPDSYEGFDFTSTWTFTEGAFRGLPHLQYQE